ncbi:hypothetical protein [Rubrivirga sp. IMCC43871]|uniref:hypothetical protein n=1 Tax=Rubrivirga sp. IMCC43871 TaxID=3391575 RepID=UPI00398FA28D
MSLDSFLADLSAEAGGAARPSPDFPNPQQPLAPDRPILPPMLAVLLALLSAVAGLPASGTAETETAAASAESVWLAGPADDCCGEIASESTRHPCPPGEPCPPTGGCCACVSCGKRVADTPPVDRPVDAEGDTMVRAPSQEPTGVDEGDAVWHPPQG